MLFRSQDGKWHAHLLDSAAAACGKTSIFYGRDPVADNVPVDGKACDACLRAIGRTGEAAEVVVEEPKKKGRKVK